MSIELITNHLGLDGQASVEPYDSDTGQPAYKVDGKVYCVVAEEEDRRYSSHSKSFRD